MTKQKPTIPAKARPLSLVARSPRSEKDSSQNLGYPVNPGNVDGRKEVDIASGNSWRSASRSEVGCSQVSRPENALMASGNSWREEQLQKQRDEKAPSNSNSTRKLVQGATSKPEYQNMRYQNHQYMTKIFQFLQKKLGMSAGYSTFSMGAKKTNVLIWCMFMSSSMKAAVHLGPNYLTNLEIFKNTNSEEIEYLFNMTQKLIMEHSEELLNVKYLESSSHSWTRSVLSHDQAIKWATAKVCFYADSVSCLGQMNEGKEAIARWEGQVEEVMMYPSYQEAVGIDGELLEFE